MHENHEGGVLVTTATPQLTEGRMRQGVVKRLSELDGLRGIAIVAVIFHHIAQGLPEQGGMLGHWLSLTRAGWLGVDVFFALSGFLITRGLLNTVNHPRYYRNFYVRRVLRLAPLYLLTLGLVFVAVPHSGSFLALSLLYLANFAKPFGIAVAYGPLWSLSVEEHFYMAWPAVARNVSRKMLLVVCIMICVLTPLGRYLAYTHDSFNPYISWFRLDGLAWGAIMAILLPMVSPRSFLRFSQALMVVGSIGFAICAKMGGLGRGTLTGNTFVYGLVAMITAGLLGDIALHTGAPRLAILRQRWLTFMGEISYWVYLFHMLVLMLLLGLPNFSNPVGIKAYLVITLVVLVLSITTGLLVRRYIEEPVGRLKEKFS